MIKTADIDNGECVFQSSSDEFIRLAWVCHPTRVVVSQNHSGCVHWERTLHPITLHLWWARRPLAARAVICAQMVDDPSTYVDVLRGDSKLVRKAEALLKARIRLWEEAGRWLNGPKVQT